MKAVNNYLKNVMKSVAYAAADVSEEHLPGIKEFASANKEFGTATYAALKNPSQFVRRQVKAIQESKVYQALDYGVRNLTEDLRTGNFYNKARKERDELALSGLDTNWDDLSEFGIDDDWESKLGSSSSDEITAGDAKIIESIEGSNAALASATVNAVVTSSQNQVKNNRANTAMLYAQNERLFGGLHKDLSILGSTMQQMYKLQHASLQNIDKNMSSFFTQEAKLSAERNAILKEMLEMQRNMYKSASDKEKEAASKRKDGRIRWSDINVNGSMDINAYFKAVKKNINNQLASVMPAGFGEDSNMLATFMVSPLEGVMKYVVNGVIPATVKAAAKEFDASVSGIFGNVIGELGNARNKNDGGILSTIAKFFGISTGVNKNIDTSRYEKGPVPFDGITRKAIIDVIPTHLRRIEAALTGRPEEMFDYKAGRWVKVSNVKKQFDDIRKNAIKQGTSDIREAMNPGIQKIRKGLTSKSSQDEFDKAIEEFEQFLYNNNGRFNPRVSASKNGIEFSTYPNLYRNYSKIKTIFKDFDTIASTDRDGKRVIRHTKNSVRMRLSGSVLDAKEAEERQYRAIESEVGNVFNSLFGIDINSIDRHGKYDTKNKFNAYNVLKDTTDKLGNTIFDYLQNINAELTWIRENGISSGVTSKHRYKGGKKQKTIDEIRRGLNKSSNTVVNAKNEDDRILKNALDAISSGKAVDLRDFDEDEAASLLKLSTMLSGDAISEYKSAIKGYNENVISGFIDKHFVKTNIKSIKDVEEAITKAEKSGKNTNEVKMDAKEEKFFQKIMNRIGAGGSIFGGIVSASAESFTNLLYAADKAVYEMMYKTEISDDSKKKYNGFMDAMVGKMTDVFEDVKNKFKEIFDPFLDRFGIKGKLKDFKKDFRTSLVNQGSRLWTAFRDANMDVYSPMYNKAMNAVTKNTDIKNGMKEWDRQSSKSKAASRARRVRASAIYKGGDELAIWCEQNGFTGNLDEKKVRLGSEFGLPAIALAKIKTDEDANKVFAKQFRHNAKGTNGRPFSGLTTLTKGEGLISSRGVGVVPKTGVYNVTTPTHIINTEDMHSITGGPKVTVQQALGKEKLAAKAAGFRVSSHAKGTMKITNKGVDLDTEEFLSQLKQHIPEAASGGLIGGILSLVLGTVGGPLLGAAVGAGASIIGGSDKLKNNLFGKAGEDGKRDGSGVISKSIMDAYNKYFPDMAKYGLAGIIPGLLTPLGPIGGLMAGAAFGFLKNNEKFTNKYFGENGKLTIGSEEKKIIEKMLPAALKGAGAGAIIGTLVGGPFGLVGNAALGSALGMMGTTEDFKNFILGEEVNGERIGGIVGAFKDALEPFTKSLSEAGTKLTDAFDKHIINPIANLIKPAIHALPIAMGALPRFLGRFGRRVIGKTAETRIGRGIGKVAGFTGGLVKGGASILGGAMAIPGAGITAVGNALRGYDINHGDLVGQTQTEAIKFMEDTGRTANPLLKFSAGLTDVNQVNDLMSSLNNMNNTKSAAQKRLNNTNKSLNKLLTGYKIKDENGNTFKLSDAQVDEVLKAAKNKDFTTISDILQKRALKGSKSGMTEAQFNDFMNTGGLKKAIIEASTAQKSLNDINELGETEAGKQAAEALKKAGLDPKILTDSNKRKMAMKFLSDRAVELEANPSNLQTKLENDNHENIKDAADAVKSILNIMIAKENGTDEAIEKAVKNAENSLNLGQSNANKLFEQNKQEALNSMGEGAKNITPQAAELLTTARNKKMVIKLGLGPEIINNITGSFENIIRAFKKKNILIIYKNDKDSFEPDAIKKLSNINETLCKIVIKGLSNKFVKDAILRGGYKITEKTISLLCNSVNVSNLIKKCRLLDQLFNKDVDEYSKYKTLEDLFENCNEAVLSEQYKIKSTSKTSYKRSNVGAFIKKWGGKTARFLGKTALASGVALGGTALLAPTILPAAVAGGVGATAYGAYAGIRGIKRAIDRKRLGIGNQTEDGAEQEVSPNALGTIFGIGKSIVKGAGSLIGSLFGKKDKGDESNSDASKAGILGAVLGATNALSSNKATSSSGHMDEVDKKGDNTDYVYDSSVGGMLAMERKSDGSVQPKTSDAGTKAALNKLQLKEKMSMKLQEAQLKAAEIIKTNFDTSGMKESKKGKIGWLGMLLMGGLLWKSGIIQKLFNGLIKPIWTNNIKPWITDTAVPWVKDMWSNKVVPFFTDTVGPWVTGTVIPAIGSALKTVAIEVIPMLGSAIGDIIRNLPAILKGTYDFGATVLDTVTGNKYGAGTETTVSGADLVAKYGENSETGMYDENGNSLSAGDIASGNYNKIYNSQGVEGVKNKDGSVSFKDESLKGASYANTIINAGAHAAAKTLGTGRKSILAKIASKTTKGVSKAGKLISKIPLVGGIPGRLINLTGKVGSAVVNPIGAAENKALKLRGGWTGLVNKTVDNATDKILNKAIANGVEGQAADELLEKLIKGDGSKLSNIVTKVTDWADVGVVGKAKEGISKFINSAKDKLPEATNKLMNAAKDATADKAIKKATEKSVKAAASVSDDVAKGATKNGGFLSGIIEKAKKAVDGLFSDSTVKKKLADVAEALHITNISGWIKKFKNSIDNILAEFLEKSIKKVGAETCKKVLSKFFAVAFLVTDFVGGCDQAESILGVEKTDIIAELVAGLTNAVCNFLIIPTLIPDGVNNIARGIYGLIDKDLEARQAEATKKYLEAKEKKGFTYSQEEYYSRKNSVIGYVKGVAGDTGKAVVGGAKAAGKAIGNGLNWVGDTVSGWFNAGGTVSLQKLNKSSIDFISGLLNDSFIGDFAKEIKFNHLNKVLEKARDGKISIFSKDYWKEDNNIKDNTLRGTYAKTLSKFKKIVNVPMLMIKGALDELVTDIDEVGKLLSGKTTSSQSSSSTNPLTTNTNTTSTKTTFGTKVKSFFTNAASKIKKFFGFGTGSYQYGTGIYSKQIDPAVAGIRFNTSADSEYQTIGNSGCGPAAAVNALEAMYGRGNAVANAAKFAISHGYKETDGGTKPGFFTDYFNRHGYNSQVSYNRSDIERNIRSGSPTVIMGKDPNGASSSTPFGRTPHYVTVTGTDGKGNAIVQDPESRYDNQLYPVRNLMKNTSLGVSAFGRGKWGRASGLDMTPEAVRQRAADWAIKTAKDNSHGYDNRKNYRGGNPDYACSSFVNEAYRQAGVDLPESKTVYTAKMKKIYTKAGFEEVTDQINFKNGKGLIVGDIVLRPGSHVEIVVGKNGKLAGARGTANSGHAENGKQGDQSGSEIVVSGYQNFNWTIALRYTGNGGTVLSNNNTNTSTLSNTLSTSSSYSSTKPSSISSDDLEVEDTLSSILISSRVGHTLVSTLGEKYGRGGNNIADAARFALRGGYKETDGGTKPGFFTDYFNRHGYGSHTSYSKSDIERNINRGLPTVIMGRDARGTSSSTPFGKTPHYVTVTGTDGRGNAIVQDPESRYDNQLYPVKSLMKNTSLGVSAFGRGKWGRAKRSGVTTPGPFTVASVDEWINALKAWCKIMVDDGDWSYSNSNNKTNYKDARSAPNRYTNCALMIVHAMQYAGLIDTNHKFYGHMTGKIQANESTMKRLKQIATIIDCRGKNLTTKNADLQPGDIVTYYHQHTNVYLGKDKNGKKQWYDAGRWTTTTGATYGRWKSFLKTGEIGGYTVSHIIRLKLNGTNSLNTTTKTRSNIIFIGDSRTVGMKNAVGSNKYTWSCLSGSKFNWMKSTGVPAIEKKIDSNTNVVILMGVNDCSGAEPATKYANYINEKASEWVASGAAVYFVSINPVDRSKYKGFVTNEKIEAFNSAIKSKLSSNVKYIDTYSNIKSSFGSNDGLHYDNATYKIIYNTIVDIVTAPVSTGYSSNLNLNNSNTETKSTSIIDVLSSYIKNSQAGKALTLFGALGTKSSFGRGKYGRGTTEKVWWYLTQQMKMTDAGAAGLMGNLEAESGIQPNNLENAYEDDIGMNDEQYTKAIDNGTIDRNKFMYPLPNNGLCGYGLAQWTSVNRKAGLYDLVKSKNVSISDLGTQLEWLDKEFNSNDYNHILKVLRSTNSLQTASDKVLSDYENPKNWQAKTGERAAMGQKWLDKFGGTKGEVIDGSTVLSSNSNIENTEEETTESQQDNSILSFLSSIQNNSQAGQAFNAMTGLKSTSVSIDSLLNGSTSTSSSSSTTASGDAAKVVEIAKGEVGTKESGVNDVKYNDWYYGSKSNAPWCAAFVSWVGNKAGASNVIPKNASCYYLYKSILDKGGKDVKKTNAQPGDIIFFDRGSGKSNYLDHTGIVSEYKNSKIHTIEGNTGDGSVAEKSYDSSDGTVIIARPKYESSSGNGSGTFDGNGIKPLSRYGQFKDSIYGKGSDFTTRMHKSREGYSKIEQHPIDKQIGNAMKLQSRKHTYSTPKVGLGTVAYGMAATPDYSKLINSIISILMTIADNTDKLNLIVTILNEKLGVNISASDVSKATTDNLTLKAKLSNALNGINTSTSKFNNYADAVGDSSINNIISAMNAIASE